MIQMLKIIKIENMCNGSQNMIASYILSYQSLEQISIIRYAWGY